MNEHQITSSELLEIIEELRWDCHRWIEIDDIYVIEPLLNILSEKGYIIKKVEDQP